MDHHALDADRDGLDGDEVPQGFQELSFDNDSTTLEDPFMAAFRGVPEAAEPGGQRQDPFLRVAYGRKLLDYEQERELGRRLDDARRELGDALSMFVACIAHLCAQWERAVVNERSPGEVLQWPGGAAPGGEKDGKGASSPARKHMATLSLQLSLWLRDRRAEDAIEAPLHLRAAFVEAAPAFAMLCELKDVARRSIDAQLDAHAPLRRDLERALQRGAAAELRFQDARRVMLESNLRLVFSIAGKFVNNGIGYDDLVQEGSIGLLRAIEKFDPGLGFKFSTYASTWIWQAITRAIANQRRTVRVPAHIHDKMLRLRSLAASFHQRTGREPDVAELMAESGFSEDVVHRALGAANRTLSLDAPLRAGEDTTYLDLTADDEQGTVHDQVQHGEIAGVVERELALLPGREAKILALRLGLGGTEPQTLEDIGALLGITRERTRQLQNRALATLRERLKADRHALI